MNDDKRFIGKLEIAEEAEYGDIEAMIDYGLDSVESVSVESNEDGTYDILRSV